MTQENKLIVLSAGGTGGHVYPAAALAQDLRARGFRVAVITDIRGKRFEESFGGAPFAVVPAGTLGAGLAGKLSGMAGLAAGIAQSWCLLGKLKPAAVIGFGGYPSVPAVLAAQLRRIPTIVHEQNAILGKANALLARKASHVALSLPRTKGVAKAARITVTGNPVRTEIAALYTKPYPVLGNSGDFRLFVMGGSLGAKVFSDVVPEALAGLPEAAQKRLSVTQQCRAEDIDRVREIYAAAGIRARLQNFFTDVPDILAQTHLVIGRSGATTVAELTAAGRPGIFVPAPYHADNQQRINADSVADAGGGWVMTQDGFTPEALRVRLETLLHNPESLFRAAESARDCGRPDAARRLGNLVTEVISGWNGN